MTVPPIMVRRFATAASNAWTVPLLALSLGAGVLADRCSIAGPALDANRFAGIVPAASGTLPLDLDNDGHLDEIVADGSGARTRLWRQGGWVETALPAPIAAARFGVVRADGRATMIARTEAVAGAWHFEGDKWIEDKSLLKGLSISGQPILTMRGGRDHGVRLRDVNNDGRCEVLIGNDAENAVFGWSVEEKTWKPLAYALPRGTTIVDAGGRDAGLRFMDLNGDGFDDVLFSGTAAWSIHLFVPAEKKNVDWKLGWSLEMRSGKRGEAGEIPLIAGRGGAVQFRDGAMILNITSEHPLGGGALKVRGNSEYRIPFEELLREHGPPPKSPAESLAAIRVRPGFAVELVASEPLTMDPVAFDWGADGKFWIVEMGDYPLGVDGQGKPGGVVRCLEDTDSDGRYDKSTVFLENVPFPNGIIPWRAGVIVSAAPDIFYAEDTDGDGKADERRVLFSGFTEGNQQHRVNGFEYGLDNWVHGANGDSGGVVTGGRGGKSVPIGKRDFRFRPDDAAFETQTGGTQHGRHRDDWGNWFGNNNSNWGWHYYLPEQYLVRNPRLTVRETRRTLANYPDHNRVFPISPTARRFNWPDAINTLTSGCSITPYRDDLFGLEFAPSVFICEPVNNLVHREVLEPDGVTFTSHRAPDEQASEFLASADNWSRFVYAKTGPDGALYVADMYRFVIEHPQWIPEEVQKRLDLRAGRDKGRIYRIQPLGAKLRGIPRLDKLDTAGLVAALDSANGWQRDSAQRLLVHARDTAAVRPLEKLAASSERPKTRLQALCTLDGLGGLKPGVVLGALRDPHTGVREHAVRLSEPLLAGSPAIGEALVRLVDDPEVRVRYQLAFSLGEWNDPRAARALAAIALREVQDSFVQTAVVTSAPRHVDGMLKLLVADPAGVPPAPLMEQLIALAEGLEDHEALGSVLREVAEARQGKYAPWQFGAVAGLLDSLGRRNVSLKQFRSSVRAGLSDAIGKLDGVFAAARAVSSSAQAPEVVRLQATRLLGRGLDRRDEDLHQLGALLRPQEPAAIQNAALAALSGAGGRAVADILVAGWTGYGPSLRLEALNVLLRRQDWIGALLTAIEQGGIPPGQISTAHQQKLLAHEQQAIRERATKIFATTNSDRAQVIEDYATVGELSGDPARGASVFLQNCAPCHRLRDEGNEIGPNVAMFADKPVEYYVEAILDPNKAVESRYLSYTAVTRSDREITGIITAETPGSIVMRSAGGAEEAILRGDLISLTVSTLSLMPDGFEKALGPQEIADLIAYIKSSPAPAK